MTPTATAVPASAVADRRPVPEVVFQAPAEPGDRAGAPVPRVRRSRRQRRFERRAAARRAARDAGR